MSYFKDVELSFPEGNNDLNTWADYCEFFCLASENKSRTIDDLKDRLLDQYQRDYTKARNAIGLTRSKTGRFIAGSIITDEFLEDTNDLNDEKNDNDFEDVSDTQKSNDSQLEDEINSEFLFLFLFLQSRANLFQASYPFLIEINSNRLSLNQDIELIDKQKIYISLLLSSILRIYKPGIRNKLGHLFEELTHTPFKKFIPATAKLEFFGAGKKQLSEEVFFSGSFADRVEKLAKVLHTDTTTTFKTNRYNYEHSGDGGLDWVSWYSFEDNMSKIPVFFGQCACGDDWIDKEWDAHDDKWSNLIQFHNSYMLFHFIGKSYRKHNGEWFKPGEIINVILIDRFRMITSFTDEEASTNIAIYEELIREVLDLNLTDSD